MKASDCFFVARPNTEMSLSPRGARSRGGVRPREVSENVDRLNDARDLAPFGRHGIHAVGGSILLSSTKRKASKGRGL